MKKQLKFLILLLLPLVFILTSCNSKATISNFETDFYSINSNNVINITTNTSKKYSNKDVDIITFNLSNELKEAISINSKYAYINTFYIPMFDNSLSCIYSYSNILKDKSITKAEKTNLYNLLSNFKTNLSLIEENILNLENTLKISNELNNLSNTENLKNVYIAFEKAIEPANDLSFAFSHLYYKYCLKNSSINYNEYAETKQAPKVVLQDICINTLSKYSYYKSLYSNVYFKMYIKGKNIPQRIIDGETIEINFQPYKYICSSTIDYSSTLQQSLIDTNSSLILENGISLYNLEKDLDDQYLLFNQALSNLNSDDDSKSSSAQLFINNFINNCVNANFNCVYSIFRNAYN